jgi:hypothetical protein
MGYVKSHICFAKKDGKVGIDEAEAVGAVWGSSVAA